MGELQKAGNISTLHKILIGVDVFFPFLSLSFFQATRLSSNSSREFSSSPLLLCSCSELCFFLVAGLVWTSSWQLSWVLCLSGGFTGLRVSFLSPVLTALGGRAPVFLEDFMDFLWAVFFLSIRGFFAGWSVSPPFRTSYVIIMRFLPRWIILYQRKLLHITQICMGSIPATVL